MFKINRYVDSDKVRAFCIADNLYTSGTNKEYCEMFDLCTLCSGQGYTDEAIIEIAMNIWEHTNLKKVDEGYTLETVIWKLLNEATVAYAVREEAPF